MHVHCTYYHLLGVLFSFCMHYFWQALKYIGVNTHLCVHIQLRNYGTMNVLKQNSFKAKDCCLWKKMLIVEALC